jgi:PAS domain S-box-containing protein
MKDNQKTREKQVRELRELQHMIDNNPQKLFLDVKVLKQKTKEQLVKKLEELQCMLNHVPQNIFLKGKDLKYINCNSVFASFHNMERSEIKGKTDFDLYSEEIAQKHVDDEKRIIKSGKIDIVEEDFSTNKKSSVFQTIRVTIKDDKGRVTAVLGIFWEITYFKQIAEIAAIKKNAILEAINRIYRESLSIADEEELCGMFLSVLKDITKSEFGFIGETNNTGRFDTIALSDPGWDACRIPQSKSILMIKDMDIRGIWGSVINKGESLITNDPSSHTDRVGLPDGHPPIEAFLGVPLHRDGMTYGMIALANKKGGYSEDDIESVEAVSKTIEAVLKNKRAERKMEQQAQEILELSTPVIQIWQGLVIAPLIGMLDSQRTQGFMERFLDSIVDTRSPVAIVDITGVPTIDTQTAQHLIEAITAARLLGTKVILTGVRPSIAQTIVHLGIDLAEIETKASLESGLDLALGMLGLSITEQAS